MMFTECFELEICADSCRVPPVIRAVENCKRKVAQVLWNEVQLIFPQVVESPEWHLHNNPLPLVLVVVPREIYGSDHDFGAR